MGAFGLFLEVLGLPVVRQTFQGRRLRERRGSYRRRRLGRREMANAAIIGIAPFVLVIACCRRDIIGMFVMPEMYRRLRFLQCAVRRGRREGELNRQQQEKNDGDEATHAAIMAEDCPSWAPIMNCWPGYLIPLCFSRRRVGQVLLM